MGGAAGDEEAGYGKDAENILVKDGEDAVEGRRQRADVEAAGGGRQAADAGSADAVLVSIDGALTRWVGEFGKAQVLHFTLVSFAWALEAIHTLVTVFADRTPAWRCVDGSTTTSNSGLLPAEYSTACSPSSSICSMDRRLWTWINPGESTVSQWDLICGQSYKKGFVQSAFFVGFLVGAGLFGYLSDSRLGRKGALALSSACAGLLGMLTAASPNYGVYSVLRLLTGICTGGLGVTSFVLGTESIGPSKRSSVGMSSMYFYPLGTVLLSGLAAGGSVSSLRVPATWRRLYLLTAAPSLLYVAIILPFLAESPRWYLVRGRREEALKVLEGLAKRNGAEALPGGISLSLEGEKDDAAGGGAGMDGEMRRRMTTPEEEEAGGGANGSLADVFRRRDTRARIMVLMVVWFACALGYYTLNLNVGNLGTNVTVSLVLNAASEVPGYAVTTLLAAARRPGRRRTLVGALAMCGLSCLATGAASKAAAGAAYVRLSGGLLSLMTVAGAYNLLLLFTAELFPTVVRNAALGLATQASAIACIASPFVALSSHISPSFPFFLVGGAATLAALLATTLPNTDHAAHFHDTLDPPPPAAAPSLAAALPKSSEC